MRSHGMGSLRSQYSWIFLTSVLPSAATILWQPMQRSTDGTPAALLRRAPEWQYWQAIWYEPAWITWLKKIGCSGPCRVVATGSTFAGSYAGSASVRTYAMTSRICTSDRKGVKLGISGESP